MSIILVQFGVTQRPVQVCEVLGTFSYLKEKLLYVSEFFVKQSTRLRRYFKIKWNRLLEHLIWSPDELPPSNRSFCLTNSVKGTQIVFFSVDFCSLYISGLGNI